MARAMTTVRRADHAVACPCSTRALERVRGITAFATATNARENPRASTVIVLERARPSG